MPFAPPLKASELIRSLDCESHPESEQKGNVNNSVKAGIFSRTERKDTHAYTLTVRYTKQDSIFVESANKEEGKEFLRKTRSHKKETSFMAST